MLLYNLTYGCPDTDDGELRRVIELAHRLSTIRNATTVVLVHDGRVAATGTHDELMATSDHYRWLIGETRRKTEVGGRSRRRAGE